MSLGWPDHHPFALVALLFPIRAWASGWKWLRRAARPDVPLVESEPGPAEPPSTPAEPMFAPELAPPAGVTPPPGPRTEPLAAIEAPARAEPPTTA